MIQTEFLGLRSSNLVNILLLQEDDTFCFSRSGVKGQGHALVVVVKPCKHDTD